MISRSIAAIVAVGVTAFFLAGCSDASDGIVGSGTIEAREVVVSATVQGRVVDVPVEEGQAVTRDQRLTEIDTAEVTDQLRTARHRLEAVQAERDVVTAGPPAEEIRRAEAILAEAQYGLTLAQRTYERIHSLFEAGSTTPREMDTVEAQYRQAEARVQAAEAQVERLRGTPRPEERRVAEARVAEAASAVRRLERLESEGIVRSPLAGTVVTRLHDPGEWVLPATPLFIVADLSVVYLTIYVPEPRLADIRLGMAADVSVDGRPGQTYPAVVRRIAAEAEFTPRNVQTEDARAQLVYAVELRLENPHGVFKIGMPAEARLRPER